jgi:hypothetical protein
LVTEFSELFRFSVEKWSNPGPESGVGISIKIGAKISGSSDF